MSCDDDFVDKQIIDYSDNIIAKNSISRADHCRLSATIEECIADRAENYSEVEITGEHAMRKRRKRSQKNTQE